jgi:hypothetical protein
LSAAASSAQLRHRRRAARVIREELVRARIGEAQRTHARTVVDADEVVPRAQGTHASALLARLDGFAPIHQKLAPTIGGAVPEHA